MPSNKFSRLVGWFRRMVLSSCFSAGKELPLALKPSFQCHWTPKIFTHLLVEEPAAILATSTLWSWGVIINQLAIRFGVKTEIAGSKLSRRVSSTNEAFWQSLWSSRVPGRHIISSHLALYALTAIAVYRTKVLLAYLGWHVSNDVDTICFIVCSPTLGRFLWQQFWKNVSMNE